MNYRGPLVEAVLLRRYKRFLADVRLPDGAEVTAHCANPGRMTSCLVPNARCRVQHAPSPKRKLAWTLEQTCVDDVWIGVHPSRANDVVGEAMALGTIPALAGTTDIAREVRVDPTQRKGSRIDFLLTVAGRPTWVEVKQATLHLGDGVGAFPDAVSARALRHVDELVALAAGGARAVLLFAVPREDVHVVVPAEQVDPAYAAALRDAVTRGLEVVAHRVDVSETGLTLGQALPFRP